MLPATDDELIRYVRLARAQLARMRRDGAADAPPAPCALAHIRRFHASYCRLAFSRLHLWSCLRHDRLAPATAGDAGDAARALAMRRGTRLALAAPRGSAKSTIHSLLLPVLDVLHARERFIVIVSATTAQARARLRSLHRELHLNTALATAFPGRDVRATRDALVSNGVRVEAFGARCELRGMSWHEFRPTKIILDDAEASAAAATAHGRDATARWFAEVVEYLGDSYTHIEVVGTLLHPRSLLAGLLERPDFEAVRCASVERWSGATALWDEWKRLLLDPADPDRAATARAFLTRNHRAMTEGTAVLWKAREDYAALMAQLALRGRAAFLKEKQNQPGAAEMRVFDTARMRRFALAAGALRVLPVAEGAPGVPVASLQVFGFLDPALGRDPARGDHAAIAVVARDPAGWLYVLDVWMRRVPVPQQIDAVFDLHRAWGFREFGFEANHFQDVLSHELARRQQARRAAGDAWRLPLRRVVHREAKAARIDRLQGLVASGILAFASPLPDEFLAQMDDWPHGRHDDGLDALAAAVVLASAPAGTARAGCITVGRGEPAGW